MKRRYKKRKIAASLPHDLIYKRFFTHKPVIISFLEIYAPKECEIFDFSTLDRYNCGFINAHLQERRSDMIWRIQRKDGAWLYAFILLEFQSSNYYCMALIIAEYAFLLLRELEKNKEISRENKAPLILPIVIYNSEEPWTAPRDLDSSRGSTPDNPLKFQLRNEYLLIDIHRITDETIKNGKGIGMPLVRL